MSKKIFTILGYFTVSTFILMFINRALDESNNIYSLEYTYLILCALIFVVAAYFIQLIAWYFCLSENNSNITKFNSSYLFSVAVLTAYIPGKIPGLLITANLSKKYGYKAFEIGASMINYQLSSLIIVSLLSLFMLLVLLAIKFNFIFITLIFIIPILLVTIINNSHLLNKLINFVLFKFKYSKNINITIGKTKLLKIFLALILAWILISFAFTTLSLLELNTLSGTIIVQLFFTFLISILISSLAFFVPSGLGVFELALYVGLQNIISEPVALAVAAFTRLIMIVPALTSFVFFKIKLKK